jgi:putative ATP-binding cassette transporter
LRQILRGSAPPGPASDEQLLHLLRALDLERALSQAGDLDTERDWPATLSMGEQQQLALGRVLLSAPQFVFLDRIDAALAPDHAVKILRLLSERSIGYVIIGQGSPSGDLADLYDAVLECMDDGVWTWRLLGAVNNS